MTKFMKFTVGKIVVMGSKTWFSLPNKLTNRVNVVVSNKSVDDLQHKGGLPDYVISFQTLDEFKNQVRIITDTYQIDDVVVIGGKTLYEQLNPIVNTIIHTQMKGEYLCDTYLSLTDILKEFSIVETQHHAVGNFTVHTYKHNQNN